MPPDDRRWFALGMELPLLSGFLEQLRDSEKIDYGPSRIARALARWENEGGAVRPLNGGLLPAISEE